MEYERDFSDEEIRTPVQRGWMPEPAPVKTEEHCQNRDCMEVGTAKCSNCDSQTCAEHAMAINGDVFCDFCRKCTHCGNEASLMCEYCGGLVCAQHARDEATEDGRLCGPACYQGDTFARGIGKAIERGVLYAQIRKDHARQSGSRCNCAVCRKQQEVA